MKLFQIEEPEGSPLESDGPGLAVGIALSRAHGAGVAVAVGGNAELLPGTEGRRHMAPPASLDEASLSTLLLALRERAEKALARPVTHAVIALDATFEPVQPMLAQAAAGAGLTLLRVLDAGAAARLANSAKAADAPAMGAAIEAEDIAPR